MWGIFSSTRVVINSRAGWAGGYEYDDSGGYEYGGEAWSPDQPPVGDESMNMVEERYHPTTNRLEVEDMNMMSIHI
jgi:hypothetical protein